MRSIASTCEVVNAAGFMALWVLIESAAYFAYSRLTTVLHVLFFVLL